MKSTSNARIFLIEDLEADAAKCVDRGYRGIVIHHAEEVVKDDSRQLVYEIDKWHIERKFNGIGYHFVVERDGTIYATNRAVGGLTGAHCKGELDGQLPNKTTVGVCLSLHGEYQDMTRAQSQALMKLVYHLGKRFFGIKHGWIFPHAVIQGDKKCPGWRVMKEFGVMNQFLDDGIGHRG